MAYEKKEWVNVPDPSQFTNDELNSFPRFDATNMNRIEDGIEEVKKDVTRLETSKAPSGHGLGTKSTAIQNITMEAIMEEGCGFYQVQNADDTPASTPSWINLLQSSRGTLDGVSTGFQIAALDWYKNNPQMWFRTLLLGEKSNWVEMLHTGNVYNHATNVVAGTYTGDGNESQFIDLGFAPKAVYVCTPEGYTMLDRDVSGLTFKGGLALKGYPAFAKYTNGTFFSNTLEIEGNGMRVYYKSYEYGAANPGISRHIYTNAPGSLFYYIAFK